VVGLAQIYVMVELLVLNPSKLLCPLGVLECRGNSKKVTKGLWLIWHTTIWVLWKRRNGKIFNGGNVEVEELVEEIKVLSWRWMLERMHIPSCLFYQWSWNPRYCLER
jgi:hypothetical protein